MTLYASGAVSVDAYRVRTGDTDSAASSVGAALVEAEQSLAEHLRRTVDGASGLASEERTARLRIHPDGRVYPPAYPVTDSPDVTIETTRALYGAFPSLASIVGFWPAPRPGYAEVTWTGGYTTDTFPVTLAHAIYDLARASLTVTTLVLAGAGSASVGDVSVSFPTPLSADVDALVPGLSSRVAKYANRLGDGLS